MNKFEKLVELIVNEDAQSAKKLFHEIVVENSRTIYEGLIDDEDLNEDGDDIEDMVDDVEADEEGIKEVINVKEAKALLDYMDGTLKESNSANRLLRKVAGHYKVTMEGLMPALEADGDEILDVAYGDEGEEGMDDEMPMGDEMGMDDEMPMDDEMGEEEIEDRVVDLEDAIDELKAEFDQMIGDEGMEDEDEDEEGMEDDFGGEEDGDMDADDFGGEEDDDDDDEVEESLVREYVEKVSAPSNSEAEGTNKNSTVAKANHMGGTSANILGKPGNANGGKADSPKDLPHAGQFMNDPKAKSGKQSFKTRVKEPAKKEKGTDKKSLLDGPKGKGRS